MKNGKKVPVSPGAKTTANVARTTERFQPRRTVERFGFSAVAASSNKKWWIAGGVLLLLLIAGLIIFVLMKKKTARSAFRSRRR